MISDGRHPSLVSPADQPLMTVVRRAWTRALETTADVGEHDNFFMVGGTSLAAVRLARLLSAELGRVVPVRLIFEAATSAELVAALAEQTEDAA